MSTLTNVFSAYASATGALYAGATNVAGYHIKPGGTAGSVVLRDGGASGTVVATIDLTTDTSVVTMLIPGNGLRFTTNIHVTLPTSATITVFCG
jgi:hypothetical protein